MLFRSVSQSRYHHSIAYNPIVPQDVKQSYMQYFGGIGDVDMNNLIQEFHPNLNTEGINSTLQMHLNILSDRCGLGAGYYRLDSSGGLTATQYVGEKHDYVRNVSKVTRGIVSGIKGVLRGILSAANSVLGLVLDVDCPINVVISDGFVEDDATKRASDREDLRLGILSKEEYRLRWYGDTNIPESEKEEGNA